ncbi:Protein EPG-5, partial [Aphelenchoides avenae]
GNRRQVLLSLVSFALIVLKLLDQGLKTYNGFKNFSKKLSDYIRKAVQYICAYWNLSKDQLLLVDRLMLQNEINRIVLQAMYYIVSKKSVGLWQFLVDFPYGTVTENCRMRCQILLRNSATTSVQKLYDIPDAAVAEHLKAGGSLADRMSDVGKEDTTYMLSALAAVISHSESEINHFVNEIIDVCFLDENTREQYYKVGSEAMSVVIERCPQMLSHVIRYIDRRIDHLDQYAVDILTNAPLSNCSLSKEDVGSLLGKWLINRPVNHPASHIARRVLTSMNWGTPSQLWIPQEVHDACADTIVKAHIVQCKSRNSLIAKSVSKAAKLATKCPDLEQQFDKFCWDVLLRLKITEKPATKPTNDLTAFFVYLVQKCMTTPEAFLESGMHYFAELVNSTCFNAAVIVLSRVVATFPARMHLFTANTSFRDCVERLIHADESHYAVQILMGADKFPGPVLRLVASAIAYQISMAPDMARKKDLSMAWMYVLTCKKTVDWNMDKFVLYLIGSVTKAAVANDPEELFGLVDVVTNLYKALFQAWKDAPRGPLSWFSSQAPPPLIAPSLLTISPWASFLLLRAEPRIYSAFYAAMNNSLGKYPGRTLDEAVKKASSKAHVAFTVDRLDYYRWLELCVAEGVSDHHSFPLILQHLCIAMFTRKDYEGKKHCPGGRFFASPVSETLFAKLRNDVLPRAEKAVDNERLSGFYHAVAQWLFTEGVYRADFTAYGDLILDYLLQMIVSGDTHLWTEFLETSKLRSSIKNDCKIYSMTGHLEDMPTAARLLDPTRQFDSMTKLFAFLDAASDTQPFPLVPIHQSLPAREQMDAADACNTTVVYSKFSAHLEELNKAARSFIDGKEKVERLNSAYLELFQKLANLFNTTILPALLYGCETWAPTKSQENRIAVTQRSIERRTLGISMREEQRNEAVREQSQFADAITEARKRKLRWAGHVARMADDRWAGRTTAWKPRGNRPRNWGMPTRWNELLLKAHGPNWREVAQDRSNYRQQCALHLERRRGRVVLVPLSTLRDLRRMAQKILSATAEALPDADTADTPADLLGSLAELHVAIKKCIAESKPAADSQRAEKLDQKVQEMEAKPKDAFDRFEALKKMPAGYGIIGIPKKPPAPNDSADNGGQQETGEGRDDGAEQQDQEDDLSKRLKELDGHRVVVLFPPSTATPATIDPGTEDAAESSLAASRKRYILKDEFRNHVGPYVTESGQQVSEKRWKSNVKFVEDYVNAFDELKEGSVLHPEIFFVPLHSMDAAGNFEPLTMKHFGSKPSGLRLYPAILSSTTIHTAELLVCPLDVCSIFGNEELDFAQMRRLKCTVPYQITEVDKWTIDHMFGFR